MSAKEQPFPQTVKDMERECCGTIARACKDMEQAAMDMSYVKLKKYFSVVTDNMCRMELINELMSAKWKGL